MGPAEGNHEADRFQHVVQNAIKDPRTLANPLVAGEMGVRFYAAAPLVTHDGYRLGTINIIDFKPREFDAAKQRRPLQASLTFSRGRSDRASSKSSLR